MLLQWLCVYSKSKSINYPECNLEQTVRNCKFQLQFIHMLPFPLTSFNFGNYNFSLFGAWTAAKSRFSRGMQSYCLLFSAVFILADQRRYLSAPKRKRFSSKILSSPPKANMFYHSYLESSLFVCPARCAKLSKVAELSLDPRPWVRAMKLFSILRHKLAFAKLL